MNILRNGFIAATGLALSACTSIGGTGVYFQPRTDIANVVRGAVASNDYAHGVQGNLGLARYSLSSIENASQSATNGCRAQAIFLDRARNNSYVHLSLKELRNLNETGQTKDMLFFTVRASDFRAEELRSALRAVENLARRNARSGLCLGMN